MILCDSETQTILKKYALHVSNFLETYEWITNAYVSDFFFKDHWKRLPGSWQTALATMSTVELSGLLDRGDIRTRQVLPLSLLSFAVCTKTFAVDRRYQQDFTSAFQTIFQGPQNTGSVRVNSSPVVARAKEDVGAYCTTDGSGVTVSKSSASGVKAAECDSSREKCRDQPFSMQNVEDRVKCRQGKVWPNRSYKETVQTLIRQLLQDMSDLGLHCLQKHVDGRLHAFFRKHVKLKKQHEILNLSKVIKLLSDHTGCMAVVDVGAGLGHLSRLLSFGFGLSVTSVEAAGSHAPKANKYDREIDRELKKKRMKTELENLGSLCHLHVDTLGSLCHHPLVVVIHILRPCVVGKTQRAEGEGNPDYMKSCLPCHVTSMIYPDTKLKDFLAIVNCHRQIVPAATEKNVPGSHTDMSTTASKSSETSVENSASDGLRLKDDTFVNMMEIAKSEKDKKTYCTVKPHDANFDSVEVGTCDAVKRHQNIDNCDIQVKVSKQFKTECTELSMATTTCIPSVNSQSETKCDKLETNLKRDDAKKYCNKANDSSCDSEQILKMQMTIEPDVNKIHGSLVSNDLLKSEQNTSSSVFNSTKAEEFLKQVDCEIDTDDGEIGFILTGLHACGDLTPTFLRFFVNCKAAQGLASVGCCYMKISDESTESKAPGYPMSEAVRCLANHKLSYNARELACHFADTYSQRLKDCPVHLRIHSYRAALEWLANQLCTDFKRTAVQIPSKKSDHMDFRSYATLGLQKMGISTELLTEELLNTATALTDQWKNVVAFYTMRLSLAPVVETLILLDRMFYLYENGYNSSLIPIFDSKLSPRNFVLLSWK